MSNFQRSRPPSGTGCSPFLDSSLPKASDPERWEGIGTDSLGSNGVGYLPVPEAPTTSAETRYFGHISTKYVPDFYLGGLVGLRQSIVIGTARRANPDDELTHTEQEQLSPFWAFPDGNVTWYVTWIPGRAQPVHPPTANLGTNFSTEIYGTHAAWLAKSVAPYLPLNGGQPPGTAVAQLDKLTSLLFQYRVQGFSFYEGFTFIGPGRFDLWVSVRQTDPNRQRPTLQPAPVPTRIEDIFVAGNPLARYMSVAGDLLVRNVPFDVMRSTAADRRATAEERATAKYWLGMMKKAAESELYTPEKKEFSVDHSLASRSTRSFEKFPLARSPAPPVIRDRLYLEQKAKTRSRRK